MNFSPRRSHRGTAFFYLILVVLIVIGAMLVPVDRATGISFFSIFAVLLVVVIAQTMRIGWQYGVSREGITVRKTFGRVFLPADQFRAVGLIDSKSVEELLRPYRETVDEDTKEERIAQAYALRVEFARIIGCSSVPVVPRDTMKGLLMNLGKARQDEEQFVLLTLASGADYLLTPSEPELFAEEVAILINP